mmetsp:Transcript_1344/g.4659  ORF Transcript_1344/g.4659 Transcript_1344/m.4659 type:complete len:202 (-) Transcript_1344:577-1182(-)
MNCRNFDCLKRGSLSLSIVCISCLVLSSCCKVSPVAVFSSCSVATSPSPSALLWNSDAHELVPASSALTCGSFHAPSNTCCRSDACCAGKLSPLLLTSSYTASNLASRWDSASGAKRCSGCLPSSPIPKDTKRALTCSSAKLLPCSAKSWRPRMEVRLRMHALWCGDSICCAVLGSRPGRNPPATLLKSSLATRLCKKVWR